MKTLTLTLTCLLSALLANAQWSINLQGGPQKTFGFTRAPGINSSMNYDNVMPSAGLALGAYLITDKQWPVNLGVGVSLRTNHIDRQMRRYDENYYSPFKGVTEWDFEHKSTFISIHPVVDVAFDKNRYFHFLLNPVISFFAGGGETGYRSYTRDTFCHRVSYDNSTDRIKKFVLGLSAQLQFQYPLTESLRPVVALGYSINNSPGDFIPTETGTFSFQAGLSYRFHFKKKKDNSSTSEAME